LYNRSGFTIIELVLSITLFVLMLGVLWFMLISYSSSGQEEDEESQYWRKLAVLKSRLRSDIRSAVTISQPIDGIIELQRIHLNGNTMEQESVTWWVHEDNQSITRYGREEITYDFNGFTGGEPLVLRLRE